MLTHLSKTLSAWILFYKTWMETENCYYKILLKAKLITSVSFVPFYAKILGADPGLLLWCCKILRKNWARKWYIMQKNHRISIKQEGTVFTTVGVQIWRWNFVLAKSTPVWRVKSPLSQIMKTLELDGYGWQWKNLLLFSIIWIGFRWCKSCDSSNFMAFFGDFLDAPPPISSLTPSCLICSSRVLKFQMF